MSKISELLLEKAAGLRELAGDVDNSSVDVVEEGVRESASWNQVKQAAVSELVEKTEMDVEKATALVDGLGDKYRG